MEILQGYKFQLRHKAGQENFMRRFAGCCRFLWNKVLALKEDIHKAEGKRPGYNVLAGKAKGWKKEKKTAFLADAHAQILQQALKDLDNVYKNFFAQRAEFPRFKKKGVYDAFRYPQGFTVDARNSSVLLPEIGWVRYRKSQNREGTAKQVTVSLSVGKWYELAWRGGTLVLIPPQYTSQRCSPCGCVDKSNRPAQTKFTGTACGFTGNADHNAALPSMDAGHAVLACGAERAHASALKQEPAYGAAR